MVFTIISHVVHLKEGKLYKGYAPYIKEMNIWLRNVDKVEIVAPLSKYSQAKSDILEPYNHPSIKFTAVPELNIQKITSFLHSVINIPFIIAKMYSAMKHADHIHFRCPGNLGLIACFVQIFFPNKPKSVKYAGNWDPKAKQPWSYKLQKWILNNTILTNNIKVLVYGKWPQQTRNIQNFITASFPEKYIEEVEIKNFSKSLNFLFVGNLVIGKNPLKAIQLIQTLSQQKSLADRKFRLEIYGVGPEREKLEQYCSHFKLEKIILLKGSKKLEELKQAYQKAHFVILPSRSEGWPKVIAEGMFFGCIPISTPVSCVPWMLGYGSRGILLSENYDPLNKKLEGKKGSLEVGDQWSSGQRPEYRGQDVVKISQLLIDQEEMNKMSEASKIWSQQYTLERLELGIQDILKTSKQISTSSLRRGGGVG